MILSSINLSLDSFSKIPLSRQLTDRLRREIIEGNIATGSILPSIRDLAVKLNISRSTVMRCYEELAGQGYIVVTPGSGTTVCRRLPGDLERMTAPLELEPDVNFIPATCSDYSQRLLKVAQDGLPQSTSFLNYGGPALDAAPIDRWRELIAMHIKTLHTEHCPSAGFLPLRKAYSGYLARTRAIRRDIDQVFVFIARELRLDLICRLLLDPGDSVAVENPGYPGARKRFAVHGADVIPIPVDFQGMNIDYLCNLKKRIKIVYVTPSHHEPTGVVMPMTRRKRLLEWAESTGAIIVEDDYDSEFRYDSRTIPSLMSLDESDSVVHISCLWKTLSPVSKLGFMIVPERLSEVLSCAKDLVERETPLLESMVLTDFIEAGHLERIISKNRKIYAARRNSLVDALKSSFQSAVTMSTESAGMDLFVRIDTPLKESEVLTHAEAAALPIVSARPYYVDEAPGNEFIIPFSVMPEQQIETKIRNWSKRLQIS